MENMMLDPRDVLRRHGLDVVDVANSLHDEHEIVALDGRRLWKTRGWHAVRAVITVLAYLDRETARAEAERERGGAK